VFAAVLGWVVLDQALNRWQLTGALLVLVSVVLGQWGAVTRRTRPAQPQSEHVAAS
jgi:drug/metabolite transporter (DMT)-like permease